MSTDFQDTDAQKSFFQGFTSGHVNQVITTATTETKV